MEAVTVNVAIYSWFVFWITYWIVGGLMSWRAHVTGIRNVTMLKEVVSVVVVNMMWSFIGLIVLCFLPLRVNVEVHIFFKLFFTYVITELWFYHLHCFAHNVQMYKHLHKLHHKFKEPYALTALYCTGYETVVINCFAVGIGPIIFQIPPPYIYLWFIIVAVNSVATHSGYSFYMLIDRAHDLHHFKFCYNYGTSPYLDMLYGTYKDPASVFEENENSSEYVAENEVIDEGAETEVIAEKSEMVERFDS